MFIYKITNLLNDKVYIGQTVQSVDKRWKQHCRKNSHCSYLKNAIRKYGRDNFRVETLKICSSLKELEIKEKYYIKKYKSLFPTGYNLTTGSKNFRHSNRTKEVIKYKALGRKHTEETKNKLSIYWKNKRTGKDNSLYKPIVCITNNTIYDSQCEAAKMLNLVQANINKVLSGLRNHTGGYVFRYLKEKNYGKHHRKC